MERRKQASRFATFLVVLLLITLPISTSAQLSASTNQGASAQTDYATFGAAEKQDTDSGNVSVQKICLPTYKDCGNICTKCKDSNYPNWNCDKNGNLKCCPTGYPSYCDKNNLCWTQSWMCDKSISCGGSWQVCGSSTDVPSCVDGQLKCCPSDEPYYWGGSCHFCKEDFPNECGGSCSKCINSVYPYWNCKSGGTATCCHEDYPYFWNDQCQKCSSGKEWDGSKCVTPCADNDGDSYKADSCGGSDCNDNDANINPGKSEVCGDGKDNDCDGSTNENCCPSDNPYNCAKTGTCWTKEKCDEAISCGGQWWACIDSAKYDPKCVDNHIGCCEPQYPYYCPANDRCFSQDGFCDGRKVYTCGGKSNVCNKKTDIGTCFGDTLRCCPQGETWWESDKQCHKSSEPQKCSVPDGTSANCDCDSDSECAKADPSRPYCEENYPSPISDGHDGCIASPPEYCGNGNCNAGSGEDYKNCASDCGQNAPKGTITAEVVYYGGSQKDKPIQGAYIYLDGVSKGNTNKDGKISFEASYGSRTVKVECPDTTFCDSITVNLAASSEYKRVRCTCNQPGDSDNDGYSDDDERLLGTDPKNANSNFDTTFTSDSVDLLACIPTPATFFIIWKEYKKSGSIIQSHSQVVNSLNVTSVMSTSFEEKPYVVAAALAAANLDAEGAEVIVNPVNVTLESVMKKAEYVDGVRMQDGILLIATDKDGQTTALIAIGAGCVGAFSGSVYGIGQGLFDDIKGVIDGIWFLITHLGEVKKIWSGAQDLVTGVVELLKSPGEAVWTLFRNILDKGQGINLFSEGRLNNPEAYRHSQVGFVYGFVTGYLVEQVALGAAILKNVAKFFKLGQLFGKTGKAAKLMEKLEAVKKAEDFGAEIAEKLSKLKYIKEGVENWLDSEIKGLARIMKHNEDWAKGLSEAEAKVAAQKVDHLIESKLLDKSADVADEKIKNLLQTNIGRKSLTDPFEKLPDTLFVKQSKLIDRWGTKELDKVTKKNWLNPFDPERVEGLNKILKHSPDNVFEKLEPSSATKLISDKKFIEAVDKVPQLGDSFTSKFKSITDIENAVKKRLTSSGVKNVYDGSVQGAQAATRSQNAASFANFEKELGAVFKNSEVDIQKAVGQGNPLGADYVAKINNIDTGISVKTPQNVKSYKKLKDDIILPSADDLNKAKGASTLWDKSILNIQVKFDDYTDAIKYAKQFLDDSDAMRELGKRIDPNKFEIRITVVDDYII